MAIKRKSTSKAGIPTGSMADIVFLLLIFFMVSTVFKEYQGLRVKLPAAEISEKVPTKRNIAHVFADRTGNISIDDKLILPNQVSGVIRGKLIDNPRLIFSLKIDEKLKYGQVNNLINELRKGEGLRVNFSTRKTDNK